MITRFWGDTTNFIVLLLDDSFSSLHPSNKNEMHLVSAPHTGQFFILVYLFLFYPFIRFLSPSWRETTQAQGDDANWVGIEATTILL